MFLVILNRQMAGFVHPTFLIFILIFRCSFRRTRGAPRRQSIRNVICQEWGGTRCSPFSYLPFFYQCSSSKRFCDVHRLPEPAWCAGPIFEKRGDGCNMRDDKHCWCTFIIASFLLQVFSYLFQGSRIVAKSGRCSLKYHVREWWTWEISLDGEVACAPKVDSHLCQHLHFRARTNYEFYSKTCASSGMKSHEMCSLFWRVANITSTCQAIGLPRSLEFRTTWRFFQCPKSLSFVEAPNGWCWQRLVFERERDIQKFGELRRNAGSYGSKRNWQWLQRWTQCRGHWSSYLCEEFSMIPIAWWDAGKTLSRGNKVRARFILYYCVST